MVKGEEGEGKGLGERRRRGEVKGGQRGGGRGLREASRICFFPCAI